MSNQQNRFFWYLRLAFVVLAYVLHPYFINQLPPLPEWMGNVPDPVRILGAIVFALIVVVGPELLKVEETPPEELWRKLLQENQKLINERLKNSLDQDRHIPISSIDSPDDLERPKRKKPQPSSATAENPPTAAPSSQKGWRNWLQRIQPQAILQNVIADKLPPLKTGRNLENLQTGESTKLSHSKPIIEIFNEAEGRLLILGEPGSGKTTELLKLAQALGEEAKKNSEKPIPFIFELSTWRGEPMLNWMVGEIVAQYGLVPKLCREWLVHNSIVPLLDGLDELGEERAKEAIWEIDTLLAHNPNQQKALVICCRVEDYESLTDDNNRRIRLKGVDRAVRLCELADDQIEGYLKQRKAEHIWDELQSNSGLMKLARNPMLLNLMPIAYSDELPDNLPQTPQDCQSRLFDDFLHRKLYPTQSITPQPLAGYEPEKAKYYLAWLAASMGRQDINQREFLVEKLQPTWLETQQQKLQYSLISSLIFGLILGLIFGLIFGLMAGLFWLIVGLITRLMSGLIDYESELIYLTESFDISVKKLKTAISHGLYSSVIVGLNVGLVGGLLWLIRKLLLELILKLTTLLILELISDIILGLIFGVILGLISGLIWNLKTAIIIRMYPNQGIWETGLKSLITMGCSIPLGPLIWIVPQWATGQDWSLTESLIKGVFFGVLLGYLLGGLNAFIQHFILRWMLCYHGRIPGNYVQFLNEASACGILKQSGGRYRFYHDKFREHLSDTIRLKVEPALSLKQNKFFGWLFPRR